MCCLVAYKFLNCCFVYLIALQIGEEMSQNSFIKQYLAKQQELLRQRLEREAQQDEEEDGITFTSTKTNKNQTLNTLSGTLMVLVVFFSLQHTVLSSSLFTLCP